MRSVSKVALTIRDSLSKTNIVELCMCSSYLLELINSEKSDFRTGSQRTNKELTT